MRRSLLFIWIAFLSVTYILGNLLYRLEIAKIPELPIETRSIAGQGLIVTETSSTASRAGISTGSQIVAVNGRPTTENQYYFLRTQRLARAGDRVVLQIQEAGQIRAIPLEWEEPKRRRSRLNLTGYPITARYFFFDLMLPLALWTIALTLHLSKAEGPAKNWASLMILSQTLWFPGEPKLLWSTGLREIGYLFNGVFGPLFFLFALVFFTRFPFPVGIERQIPSLKWIILTALMSLGLLAGLHSLSSIYHFGFYALSSHYVGWVTKAIQLLWLLCLVLMVASRVKFPQTLPAYEWRRVRLIWLGIFIGFLPPAFLLFLGQFLDPKNGIGFFPPWLQMLAFLFFLAFPLSLATSVIGWRKSL